MSFGARGMRGDAHGNGMEGRGWDMVKGVWNEVDARGWNGEEDVRGWNGEGLREWNEVEGGKAWVSWHRWTAGDGADGKGACLRLQDWRVHGYLRKVDIWEVGANTWNQHWRVRGWD